MLYVFRVGSIKLFFRYPIFLCISYNTIYNVFDKLYFVVSMNVSIGSKPIWSYLIMRLISAKMKHIYFDELFSVDAKLKYLFQLTNNKTRL